MSLLSKIIDRSVLCPSTDSIDPEDNRRECIFSENGIEIEAYVSTVGDFEHTASEKRLVILKIPGTSGRAERSSYHPAELLTGQSSEPRFESAEVWTLNHRGYGGSSGPATLQNFSQTLDAFWRYLNDKFPTERKLVTGNSLGCISALYLARQKDISGMLLRNPPPLAQMIASRPKYNWWCFGAAKFIAKRVPKQLDAIENAKHTTCPTVFVTSEKDSVVPVAYQQEILDAFAGPTHQIILQDCDHHHPPPEHQHDEYAAAIGWLRNQIEALEN